jgi:hypothetical protein
MNLGIVIGSALASAVGVYWASAEVAAAVANRRRLVMLRTRPTMPESEWYERYWASTQILLPSVRAALVPLAKRLGCDITQLLPDDSLSGTLSLRTFSFFGLDPDSAIEEYCDHDFPGLVAGGEQRIAESDLTRDSTLLAFARFAQS